MPPCFKSLRYSVLAVALTMFTAMAAQAQDFENATITTTDLGNGLYVMAGVGGNMLASVGDDGVLLIDTEYPQMADKVKAAVADISEQPVTHVLNTHWHFDHVGGNEALARDGATIMAHHNAHKRMSAEQEIFFGTIPASPDKALPMVTFGDDLRLDMNGHAIKVTHFPYAHTDNDVYIFFPDANVLHTGDLLFNKMYPFIDTGTGGTLQGMIDAKAAMLALADDDTVVIPGHGPVGTKADMAEARNNLIAIRDALQPMIDQGMSSEEIVAAKPLDTLDLGWTSSFMTDDQIVAIMVASLTSPHNKTP